MKVLKLRHLKSTNHALSLSSHTRFPKLTKFCIIIVISGSTYFQIKGDCSLKALKLSLKSIQRRTLLIIILIMFNLDESGLGNQLLDCEV